MRIAGIPLSLLTMSNLAQHLQDAGELVLSSKISRAIAEGETEIPLSLQERVDLVGALDDSHPFFVPPRLLGPAQ